MELHELRVGFLHGFRQAVEDEGVFSPAVAAHWGLSAARLAKGFEGAVSHLVPVLHDIVDNLILVLLVGLFVKALMDGDVLLVGAGLGQGFMLLGVAPVFG